jgi:hypothetical protein
MPLTLEQLTQGLTIVGKLDSQSLGVGTDISITNIDMSKLQRLMVVGIVGAVGAGNVNLKLRESKTSGGSYQDLAGAAIAQIAASSKVFTLEIRADQLDPGYQFVQVSCTIAGAAVQIALVVLGGDAPFKPAKAQDIAAVTQRVVL